MAYTYRNVSTGQTVERDAADERLDRLSERWERTEDTSGQADGETHLGSADVERPDDPGADLGNADVAGAKRDDVPSAPSAKPAGDLPAQGDPTGPAAHAATGDEDDGPKAEQPAPTTSSSSSRKPARRKQ